MRKTVLFFLLLSASACAQAATRYVMFNRDVRAARVTDIANRLGEIGAVISATPGPETTRDDLDSRRESLQRISPAFRATLDAELAGATDLHDWVDRFMATEAMVWHNQGKWRAGAYHTYIVLEIQDGLPPARRVRIRAFIREIKEVRSIETGP